MYEKIVDENPYENPMMIYPAVHYTMGGIWVDYELMTTIAGLVCDRRSQLLRSWRQPPWGFRPDAGSGRRIFRASLYHSELPFDEIRVPRMPTDMPEFVAD